MNILGIFKSSDFDKKLKKVEGELSKNDPNFTMVYETLSSLLREARKDENKARKLGSLYRDAFEKHLEYVRTKVRNRDITYETASRKTEEIWNRILKLKRDIPSDLDNIMKTAIRDHFGYKAMHNEKQYFTGQLTLDELIGNIESYVEQCRDMNIKPSPYIKNLLEEYRNQIVNHWIYSAIEICEKTAKRLEIFHNIDTDGPNYTKIIETLKKCQEDLNKKIRSY